MSTPGGGTPDVAAGRMKTILVVSSSLVCVSVFALLRYFNVSISDVCRASSPNAVRRWLPGFVRHRVRKSSTSSSSSFASPPSSTVIDANKTQETSRFGGWSFWRQETSPPRERTALTTTGNSSTTGSSETGRQQSSNVGQYFHEKLLINSHLNSTRTAQLAADNSAAPSAVLAAASAALQAAPKTATRTKVVPTNSKKINADLYWQNVIDKKNALLTPTGSELNLLASSRLRLTPKRTDSRENNNQQHQQPHEQQLQKNLETGVDQATEQSIAAFKQMCACFTGRISTSSALSHSEHPEERELHTLYDRCITAFATCSRVHQAQLARAFATYCSLTTLASATNYQLARLVDLLHSQCSEKNVDLFAAYRFDNINGELSTDILVSLLGAVASVTAGATHRLRDAVECECFGDLLIDLLFTYIIKLPSNYRQNVRRAKKIEEVRAHALQILDDFLLFLVEDNDDQEEDDQPPQTPEQTGEVADRSVPPVAPRPVRALTSIEAAAAAATVANKSHYARRILESPPIVVDYRPAQAVLAPQTIALGDDITTNCTIFIYMRIVEHSLISYLRYFSQADQTGPTNADGASRQSLLLPLLLTDDLDDAKQSDINGNNKKESPSQEAVDSFPSGSARHCGFSADSFIGFLLDEKFLDKIDSYTRMRISNNLEQSIASIYQLITVINECRERKNYLSLTAHE